MHEKWTREHIFRPRNQVPTWQNITYENTICHYWPRKDNPYHIRLTIGGDKLPHSSASGSPAVTLLEAKTIFNSVISTPDYQFICANINDYFICSPMEYFEYIKINFFWIIKGIHIQYNLYSLVEPDCYVYCELRTCMYRLKQASRIAFDNLVKLLTPNGYLLIGKSPGLWKHQTRSTVFILCFDFFGIKANSGDDANHLINTIKNI